MRKLSQYKKYQTKWIISFVLPVVALIVAVSAVSIPNIGEIRQQASSSLTIQSPTTVLLQESFDTSSSLSQWTIQAKAPKNTVSISTTNAYKGSGSLEFKFGDYTNQQTVRADRSFSQTPLSNIVFRTAFYDDLSATKGFFIGIHSNTAPENTGMAVHTGISKEYYLFRANTFGSMKPSQIKRSKGWHIFETIVTDQGTYAKIDNTFLYNVDRSLMVNTTQTKANMLRFVSTWGLYGTTQFDEITVAHLDNSTSQIPNTTYLYKTLETFYNTYRNTDFTPIYPSLGKRMHANDLRALLNTSIVFYTYGQHINNQTAIDRSKELFRDALINGHWDYDDSGKYWARGAYVAQLAEATKLMERSLDSDTLILAKNILFQQLSGYILLQDSFEQPLKGWTDSSTPSSKNTATIIQNMGRNNSSALQFSYTDGSIGSSGHNLVMISKSLPTQASSPSLKASIWFFDDMSSKKAINFALHAPDRSFNTGIVINTGISPDEYLFRINKPDNMKPTSIKRSAGWHQLELIISSNSNKSEANGVFGFIDGIQVGINTTQTDANQISLISTWGHTGTAIFDDLLVTRMPDTGKNGDTKGEENGWHADLLAEGVNYFPDIPNKDILEELARCYAYHSITVNHDPMFCHTKTVTAHDDFSFENHNLLSPSYQSGTLYHLIRAGNSFQKAGQSIPSEFMHNLEPTIRKWSTYLDTHVYQYISSPLGDWSGVTNSPYQSGQISAIYGDQKGWISLSDGSSFNLQDFISKRFILFYDLTGNYLKNPPALISTFDQSNQSSDGYKWWSDSIVAEMQVSGALPLLE